MRLTKISINGLFNLFNYEIYLRKLERITIIHGPNGYGKTTILRMLDGLFNANYWVFASIPFKEFIVYYENDSYLRVKKERSKSKRHDKIYPFDILRFEYINSLDKDKIYYLNLKYDTRNLDNQLRKYFDHGLWSSELFLKYIDNNKWFDQLIGDNINTATLIDRYFHLFPDYVKENVAQDRIKLSNWLTQFAPKINIYFIESQRLINKEYYNYPFEIKENLKKGPISSVSKFSSKLTQKIAIYLADYLSKSQSLEHSFPTRLLDLPKHEKNILTEEQIKKDLNNLEKMRKRLITVGLLTPEERISLPNGKIEDHDRNVLSLYIKDIQDKLMVFDQFAQKLELLMNIINSRFTHKRMIIEKDKGFLFKMSDLSMNQRVIIEPTNLSSGEQHQLVLLYTLLFEVKENSLILIDEPEISLHLGWQKKFLKDLSKIVKIIGLDVIIATHSPLIIHDRWDLTEELRD